MAKIIEYDFPKFECTASVDRTRESVTMCERGGWARCYTLSFKELSNYAKQWDVVFDFNKSDKIVAKVATTIILANNAVQHGLDPFRYVPKSNKITDSRDLEVIKNFEKILNKYDTSKVICILNHKTLEKIKKELK